MLDDSLILSEGNCVGQSEGKIIEDGKEGLKESKSFEIVRTPAPAKLLKSGMYFDARDMKLV